MQFYRSLRNFFSKNTIRPWSNFDEICCSVNVLLWTVTLRKKCPYSEFSWSVFSYMRTHYGDLLCKSSHSVQIRKKIDQKNFKYEHFLRSVSYVKEVTQWGNHVVYIQKHLWKHFTTTVAKLKRNMGDANIFKRSR